MRTKLEIKKTYDPVMTRGSVSTSSGSLLGHFIFCLFVFTFGVKKSLFRLVVFLAAFTFDFGAVDVDFG